MREKKKKLALQNWVRLKHIGLGRDNSFFLILSLVLSRPKCYARIIMKKKKKKVKETDKRSLPLKIDEAPTYMKTQELEESEGR